MIVRLWTCIACYYLPDFYFIFIHLIRLMNLPLTQKKKKKDVIFSGVNHHYKLLLQNQTWNRHNKIMRTLYFVAAAAAPSLQ